VCKIQTGMLAHAHERGWCCRLMKENATDPGDSYAVSRTGRLRQDRVIRQRKIRTTQRCGRSDPSLFHFKESAFIKGVAETKARCWERAQRLGSKQEHQILRKSLTHLGQVWLLDSHRRTEKSVSFSFSKVTREL
jgi:hypothetical protein